jgi:hypothetical protein
LKPKRFVPAKDFVLSKQFYQDLGFEVAWSSDDLAYVRKGSSSFLLQRFYNKEHADNFMMHLLVEDVEAWWSHVQAQGSLIRVASCGASGKILTSHLERSLRGSAGLAGG